MEIDSEIAKVEAAKIQLEMWKHSIEVTKHFTELSQKTRFTGMTAGVGGLALACGLLTQFPNAKLGHSHQNLDYEVHLAGLVLFVAAIGVYLARFLDIKLHHRMLRGSVAFTQELENSSPLKDVMGTKRGLAGSISFYSRSKRAVSDEDAEIPLKKTTAEAKLRAVYNIGITALMLISGAICYSTFEVTPNEIIRLKQTIEMPRKK